MEFEYLVFIEINGNKSEILTKLSFEDIKIIEE